RNDVKSVIKAINLTRKPWSVGGVDITPIEAGAEDIGLGLKILGLGAQENALKKKRAEGNGLKK
ncbi:MAG TPA: hypothetical protein PLL06_06890, partial [Acidobacteriota bacterium]|nr:hypothetical protein [Acidobacteriota bacterium]